MEVNLKREAIQYCTPVYSDTLNREETLETVVSYTLPDIARILDVDAAVYLRSKTLQQLNYYLCGINLLAITIGVAACLNAS